MFKIAFCDDEKISLDLVSEKVKREFSRLGFQIRECKADISGRLMSVNVFKPGEQ
ncbi:hypothetical protein SAMN06296386_11299 [Lachnospiraceae bacterium]|nr:hypothetical protein SAMN06296386_11299 [Lachnospiraceae bacterium]